MKYMCGERKSEGHEWLWRQHVCGGTVLFGATNEKASKDL